MQQDGVAGTVQNAMAGTADGMQSWYRQAYFGTEEDRVGAALDLAVLVGPLAYGKLARLESFASRLEFQSVDDLNRAANSARPNTTYVFGGDSWTTDEFGRIASHEGSWSLDAAGRYQTSGEITQAEIGYEGGFSDIGFHLKGDQFGGPINWLNVVPGNGRSITLSDGILLKNINQSAYARFENAVSSEYLNTGMPVPVKIGVDYLPGNETRIPDWFRPSFQRADGSWVQYWIRNQPGG